MEEDIKHLQDFINMCKKCGYEFYGILKKGHIEMLQNLINKYKEQEKMIELMVEQLSIYKFEEIICMETECEHITLEQEGKCIGDKECILEYFKKKAKGE